MFYILVQNWYLYPSRDNLDWQEIKHQLYVSDFDRFVNLGEFKDFKNSMWMITQLSVMLSKSCTIWELGSNDLKKK